MASTATAALERLHDAIESLPFALPGPAQSTRRAARDRLAADVAGHRSRLRDLDAPLLVVIGGGTGAGKSTVANSVAGRAVTATGVLRPTTHAPALITHPDDAGWFTGPRVLADLVRVEVEPGSAADTARHGPGEAASAARTLHVVREPRIPAGLALIDAPDIDSVATENRDLADALLDAADVWFWLATARTYADAESMGYLRRAAARGVPLALALTQVHDADADEVADDFAAKLAAVGITPNPLFVLLHTRVDGGLLAEAVIAPVRDWLRALAAPEERFRHRLQTIDGAVRALPADVERLAARVAEEEQAVRALADDAAAAFRGVRVSVETGLEEGAPLRSEVVARWNRLVSTGRLAQLVETASGRMRDWLRQALAPVTTAEHERAEQEVRAEVTTTLATLIAESLDLAAIETADAWQRRAEGRALLAEHPELSRADPSTAEAVTTTLGGWHETVAELVKTKGAARRVQARWVSSVINAAATAAIVAVFASTGGLTGAEAGIAAGASAANQTLLVKLLGAQNLRRLLTEVRADLLERVDALTMAGRRRFLAVLAEVAPEPGQMDALREAITDLADARR